MVKHTKAYWSATFDHPPINLIDQETIKELEALVAELETDKDVSVIVFDSADPEFFLAHYDVTELKTLQNLPPGPTGMNPWLDVLVRLSRLPVISVVSLRGRARGAGNEFIQSCDIRFASREKAVIGQFEVGAGAVPGGNPMVRMSELIGRGRTLEVVVGADDFSGELAERYGLVNRAVPDKDLDSFVDSFARRVASFDKVAITGAKSFVNRYTLPSDAEFPPAMDAFNKTSSRPEAQGRAMPLFQKGLQTRSDVELNLGRYLQQDGSTN